MEKPAREPGSDRPPCLVSVDVEEDYDATPRSWEGVETLERLLRAFDEAGVRATLFVTGEALERHAGVLKAAAARHEVAMHGWTHTPLYELSETRRREDLARFQELHARVLGGRAVGFRAVNHSVDPLQVRLLDEAGFLYDSSVVPAYPPFRRYRGYQGPAPKLPYHPDPADQRRPGSARLVELPVTPLVLGVPLTGTWIRVFGTPFYRALLALRRPSHAGLLLHSWDGLARPGFAYRNGARFDADLRRLLRALAKTYRFPTHAEAAREFLEAREA